MPRYPNVSERNALLTGSVFEKYGPKMAEQGDRLVRLHIGDSHMRPPYDLPIDNGFMERHPGFNRYCDTFGIEPLRDALAEKLRDDNALPATPSNVMLTAGASNALAATAQALVDVGEEVLILSPYWPFFRGMVKSAGGEPVEVSIYTQLYSNAAFDLGAAIERAITERTVALYVNSPNNPSGKVLDRAQLHLVADIARRHDLWLISDEAYDGMTFDGREHVSPGALDAMFERTISVFSFSKVFMFAGLRLGYLVSGEDTVRSINKAMVHMLYGPSTIGQQMMVKPVRERDAWRGRFAEEVERVRNACADRIGFEAPLPDGGYYFFFPIDDYLNGRSVDAVIDACLDDGVSVAPGTDFGRGFDNYLRICFAGEPPDRIEAALDRLNRVLLG